MCSDNNLRAECIVGFCIYMYISISNHKLPIWKLCVDFGGLTMSL